VTTELAKRKVPEKQIKANNHAHSCLNAQPGEEKVKKRQKLKGKM
jgi:hypothetical protein